MDPFLLLMEQVVWRGIANILAGSTWHDFHTHIHQAWKLVKAFPTSQPLPFIRPVTATASIENVLEEENHLEETNKVQDVMACVKELERENSEYLEHSKKEIVEVRQSNQLEMEEQQETLKRWEEAAQEIKMQKDKVRVALKSKTTIPGISNVELVIVLNMLGDPIEDIIDGATSYTHNQNPNDLARFDPHTLDFLGDKGIRNNIPLYLR